MKRFTAITAIVWTLVIFAFWLGSGLRWIPQWEEGYRMSFVCVLIFSLLPICMASDVGSNKK